jgi:hypothetical protein
MKKSNNYKGYDPDDYSRVIQIHCLKAIEAWYDLLVVTRAWAQVRMNRLMD